MMILSADDLDNVPDGEEQSAMEFANANNYNFKIIDEGWLKNNFTYEVFKYIKQNEIDRCKKLWRQFYEN